MHFADDVRAAVDAMGLEVAKANPLHPGTGPDGLRTAWGKLVDVLALGPPPQYRTCPGCGSVGMRAATLCGTCWKPLVPPPALAVEGAVST